MKALFAGSCSPNAASSNSTKPSASRVQWCSCLRGSDSEEFRDDMRFRPTDHVQSAALAHNTGASNVKKKWMFGFPKWTSSVLARTKRALQNKKRKYFHHSPSIEQVNAYHVHVPERNKGKTKGYGYNQPPVMSNDTLGALLQIEDPQVQSDKSKHILDEAPLEFKDKYQTCYDGSKLQVQTGNIVQTKDLTPRLAILDREEANQGWKGSNNNDLMDEGLILQNPIREPADRAPSALSNISDQATEQALKREVISPEQGNELVKQDQNLGTDVAHNSNLANVFNDRFANITEGSKNSNLRFGLLVMIGSLFWYLWIAAVLRSLPE